MVIFLFVLELKTQWSPAMSSKGEQHLLEPYYGHWIQRLFFRNRLWRHFSCNLAAINGLRELLFTKAQCCLAQPVSTVFYIQNVLFSDPDLKYDVYHKNAFKVLRQHCLQPLVHHIIKRKILPLFTLNRFFIKFLFYFWSRTWLNNHLTLLQPSVHPKIKILPSFIRP